MTSTPENTAPVQERPPRQRRRRPQHSPNTTPATAQPAQAKAAPRTVHPALDQLAQLYPLLFGATFEPLKRGIFQDLMEAHPQVFSRDALKAALAQHTRSTRYLSVLAEGRPRLSLAGEVTEPTAPEHRHLALVEVMRRRQARSREDLRAQLSQRVVLAMDASGLAPAAYAELVQSRDEWAQAALAEALAFVRDRAARAEALQRAYASSGQTVQAFAEAYGMSPAAVQGLLRLETGTRT